MSLSPFPASAKGFELGLPVACVPGNNCFIQNYVDHGGKNGPAHDYTCGPLTNPHHPGTDFRIAHEGLLTEGDGVFILAAAAGKVEKVFISSAAKSPFQRMLENQGAEHPCGTGVHLRHKGGWETYYCHLRPGSLLVKPGETVEAGQILGAMGMSGKTEFPHLHFEVRQYDNPVDPFVGYANGFGCRKPKLIPLWTGEAQAQLAYQSSGVLGGGFTADEPTVRGARQGKYREESLQAGATERLTLWAEVFGIREDDRLLLEIFTPDGHILASRDEPYEVNAAMVLQSVQADKPAEGWKEGSYNGKLTLVRENRPYLTQKWSVKLRK